MIRFLSSIQEQIEGEYDPAVGFTVSFSHVEDSGYYDCRVKDTDVVFMFHVVVNENCESNENCSGQAKFSINPTIDVSTTATSISPELSQLELLDRLELLLSGDGLINRKSKGVCLQAKTRLVVLWLSSLFILVFLVDSLSLSLSPRMIHSPSFTHCVTH